MRGAIAAPDLGRVRLAGAREHELVEADVGLDDPEQVAVPRRLAHQPDLLGELGEVALGHPLVRLREAEPLEREPDRDQDLVHLLVGDAEHDRAAVGVGDDEPLVLELAERLPHRAAARLELARDPVLDQAVAVRVAPDDDRLAQRLEHPLPPRARALGAVGRDVWATAPCRRRSAEPAARRHC